MEAEELETLFASRILPWKEMANILLIKGGIKVLGMESKLNDMSHALVHARLIVARAKNQRHAVDTAIRDERMAVRAELDQEKKLRNYSRIAFLSQVVAREMGRNVTLRHIQDERTELECIQKKVYIDRMERDRESLAKKSTMLAVKQKLVAEQVELKQEMNDRLLSVTSGKNRVQREFDASRHETQSLKRQKMMVKVELQGDKTRLETGLQEDKRKRLCQICMESPKDSVCLPCIHLHYCFACLEKHKQQSTTCSTYCPFRCTEI